MFITVEVNRSDIKRGVLCEGDSCPISLAVRRLIKKKYYVETNANGRVAIKQQLDILLFESAPDETRRKFISKFDAAQPVEPFSFILNITRKIAEEVLKPSVFQR